MLTRVEYPSAAVPGPPSLSLDITEGWSQVVVAGSLLAVRRDGTSSESQPNIVVTYIERELSFTPQDLVGEIGEALSRQTEGVSKPAYPALLGGHDFVIMDTAYREPEVGTIVQRHLITGSVRVGHVAIVHITGTCGGVDADADMDEIAQLLETLELHLGSQQPSSIL